MKFDSNYLGFVPDIFRLIFPMYSRCIWMRGYFHQNIVWKETLMQHVINTDLQDRFLWLVKFKHEKSGYLFLEKCTLRHCPKCSCVTDDIIVHFLIFCHAECYVESLYYSVWATSFHKSRIGKSSWTMYHFT